MAIYQIPFAYERYGRIEVEAGTLDEAFEKAEEKLAGMSVAEMEDVSEYLLDSEKIDRDGIVLDENGNEALS